MIAFFHHYCYCYYYLFIFTYLQSKVSSTRNGWSFRKRSARHRVLINTIISEAPSITDKESPESTAANLQMQPHFTVPEKASLFQLMDENDKISAHVDSNLSRIIVAKEDECSTDSSLEESSAILIQAAIRGYLVGTLFIKVVYAVSVTNLMVSSSRNYQSKYIRIFYVQKYSCSIVSNNTDICILNSNVSLKLK